MYIYLAGRFERGTEIDPLADELRAMGHTCTSTWLERATLRRPHESWEDAAAEDIRDIDRADMIVMFTEPGVYSRGGRHTEFGYALGSGKICVLVGEAENVFHAFQGRAGYVVRCATWGDFVVFLSSLTARPAGPDSRVQAYSVVRALAAEGFHVVTGQGALAKVG